MKKSIYTRQYRVVRDLLREKRIAANITQVELAKRLKQSQSFVSKAERGERRLDVIQLRTICHVLGTSLGEFVVELEERLGSS